MMSRIFLFALVVFLCAGFSFAHAARGQLYAGSAKINITPENPSKPVHDLCFARCLLLQVEDEWIAIISVDLGIYTSENLIQQCKEKFKLSHCYLASSHTHSGPGRLDADFIESRIMQIIEQASQNMYSAQLTAGLRAFPQLGFNRLIIREDGHARESWFGDAHYRSENPDRIPFGPVDAQVGVIKVEDMHGNTKAIVMNYACHADIMCSNFEVSADFPGVACNKVEEAFRDGVHCLFVQGAAGNVESLIISSRRTGPDDVFKSDYHAMERVGELLAIETVKLMKNLHATSTTSSIDVLNDSLHFVGRFDQSAEFDIHTSTLLLNDNILVATCPGEPFAQLQLDWKRKLPDAIPLLFGYTWYAGTWPNYIPDIESAARGGYGADQAGPTMIQVGSGEQIMNKHLENYYRLNGLMRENPGPVGFKAESRWIMQEIPRGAEEKYMDLYKND